MSKVKAEGKVNPSWIKEEGVFDNKVVLAVEGLHLFYEKMLRKNFKGKCSSYIRIH